MDPLSDVLSILKPTIVGAGAFDLAGAWAIGFPRHQGIKCYALAVGDCWLALEGVAEPFALHEGDCFLLPHGLPFRIASDLAIAPIGYERLLRDGDRRSWNGGGECLIVGGHFALPGTAARLMRDALGPVVHLQGEADRAAMHWALDRMRQELNGRQLGGSLMMQQLTQMILIQVFRRHIEERRGDGTGWLFALGQSQLCRAISAIHGDPARKWTVADLAREAGASRSSFSRQFTERVGQPPIDYVTSWRMMLAADRLENGAEALTTIARSLGYETDSAFCAAFRRVMGSSPRQYGRQTSGGGKIPVDEDRATMTAQ